jgi:hypothetical protein
MRRGRPAGNWKRTSCERRYGHSRGVVGVIYDQPVFFVEANVLRWMYEHQVSTGGISEVSRF